VEARLLITWAAASAQDAIPYTTKTGEMPVSTDKGGVARLALRHFKLQCGQSRRESRTRTKDEDENEGTSK
jgi:hypothetical protein